MTSIDIKKIKKASDYIRYLSLTGVERANSGHPGLPLGCAEVGVLLYRYLLNHNTSDPRWMNRDRFILSAGHGSMLLYSLLYSAGYGISIEDIADFRQLGSKTPGHPEYEIDLGIETTTGPLGQGFSNTVGIAIEGKHLAAKFNKKGFPLFDFSVYTLMGDGCNMEGVSYESASLAGHLGLDNIIALYDSNKITIDGSTEITFTEDVAKRYKAMNWHVDTCSVKNIDMLYKKINALKKLKGKPKLLIIKTTIGEGLDKKKGTHGIHGAPAGVDEIVYFIQHSNIKRLFEEKYGKDTVANRKKLIELKSYNIENNIPPMESPEDVDFIDKWSTLIATYKKRYPKEYGELNKHMSYTLPASLKKKLLYYKEEKPDATRNISGRILNICADEVPNIIGGSADLVGSTKATIKSSPYMQKKDFSGRNIAFGVREHAMGSIGNGLALNSTLIPFTSTFFTFFDYMKPSVRLAALMKLNQLFIFTHDSIYVGEDGPTHQPIEHLNALRLIPNLYTFRPANDIETAFSYLYFFEKHSGPAAIICSRQKMAKEMFEFQPETEILYNNFQKGAYILYETERSKPPDIILGGSGSEVGLALHSAKIIESQRKRNVRVVSFPCLELFHEAPENYKNLILGTRYTPIVFIEAASHRGVRVFSRKNLTYVTTEDFGHSGPAEQIGEQFGFVAEKIYELAKD
ncbi:transketolase [Spirochaetota bacterium]